VFPAAPCSLGRLQGDLAIREEMLQIFRQTHIQREEEVVRVPQGKTRLLEQGGMEERVGLAQ
jgi:hypothetical protein